MRVFQNLLLLLFMSTAWSKNYDFIIVGGGAPAAVMAYRLTENPKNKVLVLERGQDLCDVFSDIVGFYGSINTASPTIIPDLAEKAIYDRHWYSREIDTLSKYIPMPTMLGGGALRNGNAFGRMSFQEMAAFNSSLWTFNATTDDWKALFTYEKCLTEPCDTNAHGTTGPLTVNTFELNSVLQTVNTAFQSKFNLSWIDDSNAGVNQGLSVMHRNIKVTSDGPVRQEPYCNLLKNVLHSRKKLDVLTGAVVTKLDLRSNGKNRVEYYYKGHAYSDKARKEVIVANNPLEAPKLLKLSGVGPCDELNDFDIDCLHENVHVGEDVLDNPTLGIIYLTPPPTGGELGSILVGYVPNDQGPLAGYEIAATSLAVPTEFGVLNGILSYVSDFDHGPPGKVLLRSKDPLVDPVVNTNFYNVQPERISRMRNKIKEMRAAFNEVNQQFGFSYFTQISPSLETLPLNATDEQIDNYLLSCDGISASWHWTGGTAIHKVVDERLRLIDNNGHIIPGVRVVTNGIVPNVLKSHSTSSFSMHSGQIAARFIQEDYNL